MAINLTRILCKNALAAHQLKTFTRLPQQMTMFTTSQLNAPVTLKLTKPSGIENLPYEEKNALLKREQSPHLTIYKPQLTSMLSITHRMTGMTLSGVATTFAVGSLLLPNDFSYFLTALEGAHLSSPTLFTIKLVLAWTASYHTLNGVRHLLWDNGKFLKLNEVYSTGKLVVALSVVSAILLAAL